MARRRPTLQNVLMHREFDKARLALKSPSYRWLGWHLTMSPRKRGYILIMANTTFLAGPLWH
jgi:hypothetical protein